MLMDKIPQNPGLYKTWCTFWSCCRAIFAAFLGHDTHMPSQLVIVEMPQKLLLQMTSNLVISWIEGWHALFLYDFRDCGPICPDNIPTTTRPPNGNFGKSLVPLPWPEFVLDGFPEDWDTSSSPPETTRKPRFHEVNLWSMIMIYHDVWRQSRLDTTSIKACWRVQSHFHHLFSRWWGFSLLSNHQLTAGKPTLELGWFAWFTGEHKFPHNSTYKTERNSGPLLQKMFTVHDDVCHILQTPTLRSAPGCPGPSCQLVAPSARQGGKSHDAMVRGEKHITGKSPFL